MVLICWGRRGKEGGRGCIWRFLGGYVNITSAILDLTSNSIDPLVEVICFGFVSWIFGLSFVA